MINSFKSLLVFATLIVASVLPAISAAGSPDSVAVWSEKVGERYRVLSSERLKKNWSEPTVIAESENRILAAAIGSTSFRTPANENANSVAVWTEIIDQKWVLKYAESIQGKWQDAQTLTTLGGENLSPIIVHDLAGTAWVFWSSNVAGNDDIYLSRRVKGRWIAAQLVNEANQLPDILPLAYLDKKGSVIVQWSSLNASSNSYSRLEKAFPLDYTAKQKSLLRTTEKKPQTNEVDLPLQASAARRVNLHFPHNPHDQSVYIQPQYNPVATPSKGLDN